MPNLRLVALWLTKPPNQPAPEEQHWVKVATSVHPQVAVAEQLAQQFRQAFKDRNPDAFRSWLVRGIESEIPEVKGFIAGIQRDYEAVLAAVDQSWSNGQVEGQVHRLKLIKRQMYGRGGFQLLRRRVRAALPSPVFSELSVTSTKSAEDPNKGTSLAVEKGPGVWLRSGL